MGGFSNLHRIPSRNGSGSGELFFGVVLAASMTLVYAYIRQTQNPPQLPPPPPKNSELLQYNSKFFTLPGSGRFLKVADQIRSV